MAPAELLITIVAESEPAAFLLFRLGKVLDRPAFHGHRRWHDWVGRCNGWRQQGETRHGRRKWRSWQHASGRHRVLVPQCQLARQAHGTSEGLGIVDLHIQAERGVGGPR